MKIYLDTSTLAKAYLNETGSAEVQRFISLASSTFISSLNITELRCLLARRARVGDFTAEIENRLWSAFQTDVQDEVFELVRLEPSVYTQAAALIDRVAPTPLRTLDALHLCVAEHLDLNAFITNDKQLAKAARMIGLPVEQLEITQ